MSYLGRVAVSLRSCVSLLSPDWCSEVVGEEGGEAGNGLRLQGWSLAPLQGALSV